MKLWTPIEVTWVDSDHNSGWQLTSDIHSRQHKPMICRSTGYFFREHADTLEIVQSYSSEGTSDEQVDGVLRIPKVAIKRKRVLK